MPGTTSNPAPAWATDLVDRASAFLGTRQRPVVVWHHANEATPTQVDTKNPRAKVLGKWHPVADFSGGWRRDASTIEIWIGQLRNDQRLVLLHELAHWFRGLTHPAEGHSAAFWDIAWTLYQEFMPRSIDYVLEREARYKTGALRAAIRAGIIDQLEASENPHLRRGIPLL